MSAATGNAVAAGIQAGDAVSAARQGTRWVGEHNQAPAHLEKAGADGRAVANHLRRLLPERNRAFYDPTPVTGARARELVKTAERAVAVAARVVMSLEPR